MKKFKNLLIVAVLLMVLSLLFPVEQAGSSSDEVITICSDSPPSEVIGLY